jgi:hypothetical protein
MLSSQAQVLSNGDLTAGYRPAVSGFDELMTPSGVIGRTGCRFWRRSLPSIPRPGPRAWRT